MKDKKLAAFVAGAALVTVPTLVVPVGVSALMLWGFGRLSLMAAEKSIEGVAYAAAKMKDAKRRGARRYQPPIVPVVETPVPEPSLKGILQQIEESDLPEDEKALYRTMAMEKMLNDL